MSRTRIVHDPACQEPLNQHTGNEPCLTVLDEEEISVEHSMLTHYMQGTQGQKIDYRADYLARYGDGKVNGKHPPLVSTMPDLRPQAQGEFQR